MAVFTWSLLSNNDVLTFDLANDVLKFDDLGIPAASVLFAFPTGASCTFRFDAQP